MTAAPDFLEPVLGYRAWHLDDDGLLRPWTFSSLPWALGVTTAVCARVPGHRPPVGDCTCGLYALTDPGDRRLDFHGDQAIGAIAAWGDLEVHRTGFRAEHACVLALAVPDRPGDELLRRLRLAAERHGVPLVPARRLSAEAHRHGAPLPDVLPGAPADRGAGGGVAAPAIDPSGFAEPARGIVPDAHLWLETALGCVVVGLTKQLGAALGPEATVSLAEAGRRVEAGERVGTVASAAGTFAVWAPVGGTVLAVNPRLAGEGPDRGAAVLRADPEGAGWLLRLLPDDWAGDASACTWGPAASASYAAGLARDGLRGDPFADVRLERLRAVPSVASWADVLDVLRGERRRGRFPDAGAVSAQLAGPVQEALEGDPRLRALLGRLDLCVAFELPEPGTALVLDLAGGDARLADASAARTADLRLSCTPATLHRWLTGTLDPAAALRRGDLRSNRPAPETLRALAVLKHLRVPRRPPEPSWLAPSG